MFYCNTFPQKKDEPGNIYYQLIVITTLFLCLYALTFLSAYIIWQILEIMWNTVQMFNVMYVSIVETLKITYAIVF